MFPNLFRRFTSARVKLLSKPSRIDYDRPDQELGLVINRFYWWQIGLIAIAVLLGVAGSFYLIKDRLLSEALKQEADHYWQRYERGDRTLPDTKHLFGFLWSHDEPTPALVSSLPSKQGVQRWQIADQTHLVIYDQRHGQNLILVLDERHLNRFFWLFGLVSLVFNLLLLCSVLWIRHRRARSQGSVCDESKTL